MRRIVGWLLVIATLGAGGYALWRRLAGPIEVRAAPVVRGPAVATVFATGWIEPRERRLLRPARPALVERFFALEGAEVPAGGLLARLRDTARDVKKERVQAELDRIEADLAEESPLRTAAKARIAEARVNEEWARGEVERARPLLADGLVEARAFEQLEAARDAASERARALTDELAHTLEGLETARRRWQAELETLLAAERDDAIVAPFDGVVLARFAEDGESVNPERDLLKFGDVRELWVEGEVDEEDVARVAVGQRVLVRVAGDTAALVEGLVHEVFPDSNKVTRSYRVRVAFPGATFTPEGALGLRGTTRAAGGRLLLPGSSCELGIVVDERADALVFPRPALTARGTVFVAERGAARERSVEVGLANFDRCEARAGLSEGELVIFDRIAELRDGRRVTVREAPLPRTEVSGQANAASRRFTAVVGLDGEPVDPVGGGAAATVLLFTRGDCPISNKYAPEVRRLIERWRPRGVSFCLVYVDPDQGAGQVREHVREHGYDAPVALDLRHELVALVGATITPEAALFTRDGRLAYHGRIDDRFADLGVERAQPTTRDLEAALAAVLDGREPDVATAPPVGCLIADLR